MHPLRSATCSLVLAMAAVCWPGPLSAAESYDNCTGFIDTVPAVITTQGVWCLRKDLSTAVTTGSAITVNTNNVTIDCNVFKLGGLAAGLATNTNGIQATNRLNVTVRHCNIRGFLNGLKFDGAAGGGHVVEDSRFDGNTLVGFNVEGDGSVVRRNLVRDTGGSTSVSGNAQGIRTKYSVDVLDNTISGVLPSAADITSKAYGIYTHLNSSGSISGNRARGLVNSLANPAFGIYNDVSGRIGLAGNQVSVDGVSLGNIGLYCSNSMGIAKDNIISGFAVPISSCSGTHNENVP